MEWKELEIANLPPDILTGDYEWQISQGYGWEGARAEDNPHFRIKALEDLQGGKSIELEGELVEYRYRKPEPKAPSHEEIKFIVCQLHNKTEEYDLSCRHLRKVESGEGTIKLCTQYHLATRKCIYRKDFIGRESGDIPPEV